MCLCTGCLITSLDLKVTAGTNASNPTKKQPTKAATTDSNTVCFGSSAGCLPCLFVGFSLTIAELKALLRTRGMASE